ncbi:hypothetical protein HCJ70_11420 [Listeria booriae]|uniref:hypothetical protein n=1 Tax=Listeria booriae TaxID=1552123 RepID=UPI001626C97E|nr:hypothetical protein [Listeria booriae]MBC2099659.1 hypothetical protein [Listeria booriae]
MIHNALIIKIEEEDIVTIKMDEIELTCFSSLGTDNILVNRNYPIELSFFFIEDEDIIPLDFGVKEVTRIDGYFKYELKGKLTTDGVFDFGILIEDDTLASYPYLFGTYIKVNVDRIDIAFL